MTQKIYPRSRDRETIYLKSIISNPNIIVGDYTMYNDFVREPKDFEKNNVLYQYPINQDRIIMVSFVRLPAEQNLYSIARTIVYLRFLPIHSPYFLKNGI